MSDVWSLMSDVWCPSLKVEQRVEDSAAESFKSQRPSLVHLPEFKFVAKIFSFRSQKNLQFLVYQSLVSESASVILKVEDKDSRHFVTLLDWDPDHDCDCDNDNDNHHGHHIDHD